MAVISNSHKDAWVLFLFSFLNILQYLHVVVSYKKFFITAILRLFALYRPYYPVVNYCPQRDESQRLQRDFIQGCHKDGQSRRVRNVSASDVLR